MFFMDATYNEYLIMVGGDTDFRAYCDKLASVFALSAGVHGTSSQQAATFLIAQNTSTSATTEVDEAEAALFKGLFDGETNAAMFLKRERLWYVALFLLSITKHLGNWGSVMTSIVPEPEPAPKEKVKAK